MYTLTEGILIMAAFVGLPLAGLAVWALTGERKKAN